MKSQSISSKLFLPFFVLALLFSSPPVTCVRAATFTVDTTADTDDDLPGDCICADINGNCSLRTAISEANALAVTGTITLWLVLTRW